MEGDRRAHLLDLIFTGAEESPPWGSLLKQLRADLSLSYAAIVMRHSSEEAEDGYGSSDADWDYQSWWKQIFAAHYPQSNTFLKMNLAPGAVLTLKEVLDRDQGELSPTFVESLHAAGIDDLLYVNVGSYNEYSAHMYLARSDALGTFCDVEKQLCAFLVPHLERSLRLYSLRMSGAVRRDIAQHALSHLGVGSLLLDQDATVLGADHFARSIIKSNPKLTIKDNRFKLHDADLSTRFQAACDALLSAACHEKARALSIQSLDGEHVQLLVKRIEHDYGQSTQRYILVLISDTSRKKFEPTIEVVRDLFNLTNRESSIAVKLAQGYDPTEIAGALGLRVGTVRTHLKSIFSKTGMSRQADLVRAISMSVALFATDNDCWVSSLPAGASSPGT